MAKQSDHIEDRFRQAAENISVPPNAQAWERMEQLLDKEKQRKPVIYWWYLLLFFTMGIAGVLSYQLKRSPAGIAAVQGSRNTGSSSTSGSTNGASATGKSVPKSQGAGQSPAREYAFPNEIVLETNGSDTTDQTHLYQKAPFAPSPGSQIPKGSSNTSNVTDVPVNKPVTGHGSGKSTVTGSSVGSFNKTKAVVVTPFVNEFPKGKRTNNQVNNTFFEDPRLAKEKLSSAISTPYTNNPQEQSLAIVSDTSAADLAKMKNDAVEKQARDSVELVKTTTAANSNIKKDSSVLTPVKLKVTNHKWKLDRGFNISVTGELDATSLHQVSLDKFKPLMGLGLGYRFSNRLSLQTGMFIQRAIYFANPEDYTVKPGSYLSMYRISKIDANCLFYEIPLNIRYDFFIGKAVRLYANTGLNSYIMKHESYRYHATGSMGYRRFDSTFTTNKNIFASVYFSAGVEKKITPSLSLQLEPYVKMPNSGLGEGKVKLYSSGVQLSLKFQPVNGGSRRNK